MAAKKQRSEPNSDGAEASPDDSEPPAKGKARKKRKGARHRGVVLLKPEPAKRMGWRARYRDADTGKLVKVSLPLESATTEETRAAWAVRKSKELVVRKAQLDGGASPISRNALTDAVDGYYKAAENELRPTTVKLYKAATALFLQWARARNILNAHDLKGARLAGFRDFVVAQRKKSYERAASGRKAARKEGRQKLSPQTVNWQLRAVKKVLNHLRQRGMVPLTSDQIRDALQPMKVPREAPEFLEPAELRRLLEAVLRHDSDCYSVTREEHIGERPKGSTLKYDPIAPFVATTLLTGMRVGEVLALKWSSVDLTARDADGDVVGQIELSASETKTAYARKISLDVSPSVKALLAALKLCARRGAIYVFGGTEPLAKTLVEAARLRLGETYGAPEFSWQLLRSTCATFQCNAPGLFGDAAAFRSAKRLGHAVAVSEKHYADQYSVSRDARTLEAAMQIEALMQQVVERASEAKPKLAAVR
jgi:integrase